MKIQFNEKAGIEYAVSRFFEMSGLEKNDNGYDVASDVFNEVSCQINMQADVKDITDNISNKTIMCNSQKINCDVLNKLTDIEKVYAYVLTIGELKEEKNSLKQVLSDIAQTAFVDLCFKNLKEKVISDNEGLYLSATVGPGFYGMESDSVEKLMLFFDENACVRYTNKMMLPLKSNIGIFVLTSTKQPELNKDCESCKSCKSHINCRYCKNYTGNVEVFFKNENKLITVTRGSTIKKASQECGVMISMPCGGMGKCGKCKVKISKNNKFIEVLACQYKIEDNITVYTDTIQDKIFVKVISDNECDEYFAAIDVGTTNLSMKITGIGYECNIDSVNPQTYFAKDVMGRIAIAKTNSEVLRTVIIERINEMFKETENNSKFKSDRIKELVFASNTVMHYLATGENTESLGMYPYRMDIESGVYKNASEIGIKSSGKVFFPKHISAFIGSDIVCGIVSQDLWEKENTLFIDIGTNGEMVAHRNGRFFAASTSAGPAFEGVGIRFGMRACDGAISGFEILGNAVNVQTIGKKQPTGICASGLIDIVAQMLEYGIIDKTGTFNDACISPARNRITEFDGEKAFCVCTGIYITQSDIREVQLAKSAIRAGIEVLGDEFENIIIAGAVGEYSNVHNMIRIGMLPQCYEDKVSCVGNAALKGAQEVLKKCKDVEEIIEKTEVLMLGENERFKTLFVDYMNF